MHSNVTIKNVSWPHFSWATLYNGAQVHVVGGGLRFNLKFWLDGSDPSHRAVSLRYADVRRCKVLLRETRTKNLVQETCMQVACTTIQVTRTRKKLVGLRELMTHGPISCTKLLSYEKLGPSVIGIS